MFQPTKADSTISKDPVLIRQSLLESMKGFPGHAKDMIGSSNLNFLHLTADLKYFPPWDLLLSNNFRKGTVTVAGDAMHATGPFIAQGGSASIEDAVVLARCLAQKMHNTKNVIERNIVEEALDQYVKERKMRIFWLSLHTFLVGKKLDAKSLVVKSVILAFMAVLFRDPNGHTHYDCGTL